MLVNTTSRVPRCEGPQIAGNATTERVRAIRAGKRDREKEREGPSSTDGTIAEKRRGTDTPRPARAR